jgi:methylmalonyl-CoA mutase
VVDPWGGSYAVEWLTDQLVRRARTHLAEIEELGGMAKAIETGLPKMRIEEAAARKQARIDAGTDVLVGVNRFRTDAPSDIEILSIDNSAVRRSQVERLEALRAERDPDAVRAALEALEAGARAAGPDGDGPSDGPNLLALAVDAARARATLGEISDALERVFGRYRAVIRSISGVYAKEIDMDERFRRALDLADRFADLEGRRPRILVAKLGQDGHDRGAKVIATSFADLGFDVDIGPLFQTPAEVARQAVENDVHVVGVSSLAGGHKALVPEVVAELQAAGREDIMVICGGVIPEQDYEALYEAGAVGIFGPGTVIAEAAAEILELLIQSRAA